MPIQLEKIAYLKTKAALILFGVILLTQSYYIYNGSIGFELIPLVMGVVLIFISFWSPQNFFLILASIALFICIFIKHSFVSVFTMEFGQGIKYKEEAVLFVKLNAINCIAFVAFLVIHRIQVLADFKRAYIKYLA